MRVLVACEFSGIVRDAFRARGHEAASCDLIDTETPGPHIKGDIMRVLQSCKRGEFGLIIAHPPCTALAVSGNRHYADTEARRDAIDWTAALWWEMLRVAKRACLENPVSVLASQWLRPTQYIQPWQFGHGETKKTGLWLHNVSPLIPTDIVDGREPRVHRMPPGPDRWKARSRTFQGIADAMADQWGGR